MSIIIKKKENEYEAIITPPHCSTDLWQTEKPTSLRNLIKQLEAQGCHPFDIGDALYELDPEWAAKLDTGK